MGRKEEYKLQNEQFMQTLRTEADVHELPCGILYKVLEEGTGAATPRSNSVVSSVMISGIFFLMVQAIPSNCTSKIKVEKAGIGPLVRVP